MKKLVWLFGTFLLILTSCSKETISSTPTTTTDATVLLRELVNNDSHGANAIKYYYNGSKIVSSVNQDGTKVNYTYTVDFISKIDEIDQKGIVSKSTEFIYANGKLIYEISKFSSDTSKKLRYEYTYNTDNSVTYKLSEIDAVTGAAIDNDRFGIGKFTYKDGNLVGDEYSFFAAGVVVPESVYSNTYQYDAKNNPFYNILGFSLLLGNINSANNLIKAGFVQPSKADDSSNSFIYNVNGFPILRTDQSGTMTQYIY